MPVTTVRGGLLLLLLAAPLSGQEPDTLRIGTDTLAVDTTAAQVADTTQPADSLVFHTLPSLPGPDSSAVGVWRWDRDALLGQPSLTLLELLERVPRLLPLRYGDYGAPEGVLAPGVAGGRVRVFVDGFELTPLDGSIPDLSRVSLGALSEVRVERTAGEVRIELTALRPDDARPFSLVEAGTGDLDTNFFRGTFLHPRALGGSVGVSLERIDTRGTGGNEEGSRQGVWLRYALHRGDDAGLSVDLRRSRAEASLAGIPPEVTRTDWTVRGRVRLAEGAVAEAYTGSSRVSSEPDGLTPIDDERRQHGLRLGLEGAGLWARAEGRLFSGPDLPSLRTDLSGGGTLPGVGGAAADWSMDRWEGESAATGGLRVWTEPRWGVSLFGAYASGGRGARVYAPRVAPDTAGAEPDTLPTHRFSDVTTTRLGARLGLGPLDATGSWIRTESDSLLPLGLLLDRDAVALEGDEVTGFEVHGRVALPVDGFALVGSLLQWEEEGPYRPRRQYQGGLDFHDVFYPSRSLEVWGGIVVQGRDPMPVPFFDPEAEEPTLLRVPFYQSWNVHLQVRVQTFRLFIRWDNAFLRANNQDVPGRVLPTTRALYGVRWTLWN